jgi:hypothetical protein
MALKQERLGHFLRQSVGKAITKIEFRAMSSSFPEIAISFARNASLLHGDDFDYDICLTQQLVKTPPRYWITTTLDDGRCFDVIDGRNTTLIASLNQFREVRRFGLIA